MKLGQTEPRKPLWGGDSSMCSEWSEKWLLAIFHRYSPVINSLTNLELGYVTRSLDQHLGPIDCDRKTIHL